MANQVFKESFTGPYDGVIPASLLPVGAISAGSNVRKVSIGGGWKGRKGSTLKHTTGLSDNVAIESMYRYKNPVQGDIHFLAQCNSLLYEATDDVPTQTAGAFGTSIGVTVGTTPGFYAQVGEYMIYADGSGVPTIWGGDTPFCIGFFVYDAATGEYADYTRKVTDSRTDTEAIVLGGATDKFVVLTSERASAIHLVLGGTVNAAAQTIAVQAWRNGGFTAASGTNDTTDSPSGTTLAISGSVSWTASASDTMTVLGNIMGYAYEFSYSGALTGAVDVVSCKVTQAPCAMTNKWNGVFEWVTGCRFYDSSAGEYQECLGKVTNESESQYIDISEGTTTDFIYIKTPEPAAGFGIGIATGYGNTAAALIDQFDYHNGTAWTAVTADLTDTTVDNANDSSFSQTGTFFFDSGAITPQKKTMEGDRIPGYWYRISWAATLSTDTRVTMVVYAPHPEALPAYNGCTEFKGRLCLWGDPEYPNRLRFSSYLRPDCFSGTDSGYTTAFGDDSPIKCALNFYNELVVFKENSVWLMEGDRPTNFGSLKLSDTVGLAGPKTARVVEVGFPTVHADEPLTIVIWQDIDGIYVLDGRKPRKVSLPVDNFFNPEFSDCIAAASIMDRQAFIDPNNNEYHLLLPATELVYNYILDQWYPPWTRGLVLNCGAVVRGSNNRYFTLGGTVAQGAGNGSFVFQLENDTTDKTAANVDVKIEHSIKTRAISADQQKSSTMEFMLRRIWGEFKARAAGTLTTKVYKDMATSGTSVTTPAAMSLVNTGYAVATPRQDLSVEECVCFEFEFIASTADLEMEIWSMIYELDISGQIL